MQQPGGDAASRMTFRNYEVRVNKASAAHNRLVHGKITLGGCSHIDAMGAQAVRNPVKGI
jgi:hypothetical protein